MGAEPGYNNRLCKKKANKRVCFTVYYNVFVLSCCHCLGWGLMYPRLTCNSVAKAGFELLIPFPSPRKCWDHRCWDHTCLLALYWIRESRSPLKQSHTTGALLLPLLLLLLQHCRHKLSTQRMSQIIMEIMTKTGFAFPELCMQKICKLPPAK